jgi:hypothetical protein
VFLVLDQLKTSAVKPPSGKYNSRIGEVALNRFLTVKSGSRSAYANLPAILSALRR